MANVTHDLRTPLNGIVMMIEYCVANDNINEIKLKLKIIKMAALNLRLLINDIID